MPLTEYQTLTSGETINTQLHIIGTNKFNNEILATFFHERTGIKCSCTSSYDLHRIVRRTSDKSHLLFLDCSGLNYINLLSSINTSLISTYCRCHIILFNVSLNSNIEKDALRKGVHGIIYKNQPTGIYTKAVRGILNGELWYPRKILEQFFLEDVVPEPTLIDLDCSLSVREKEVLLMLAMGKTNQDISKDLNISFHTVKSHTYKIYKKLKVKNRQHAVKWLTNNGYKNSRTI